MPHQLSGPDDNFRLLSNTAAARNMTVEALATETLQHFVTVETSTQVGLQTNDPVPSGESAIEQRLKVFDNWTQHIETLADRYSPGHRLNDARDSI